MKSAIHSRKVYNIHQYSQYQLSTASISVDCKSNRHLECADCMCKCHIPGTMENLAKKIAKLEKDTPGVGETL